ncbi:hypothetical protein [Undibacterium sp. Ren11W]|uniref:hypothetical protein n=1 Tax=Undibacterium sp. Ren11W TaxID=3413045 RepID=UPI003BF032DF
MAAKIDTTAPTVGQSGLRRFFEPAIYATSTSHFKHTLFQTVPLWRRNPHAPYRADRLETRMGIAQAPSAIKKLSI